MKIWFSTYLVIPSTLYFGSWTLICGLAQEMESISPPCSYFLKMGLLRTQTANCISSPLLLIHCWWCGGIAISLCTCSFRSWVRSRCLRSCRIGGCSSSSPLSRASPTTSSSDAIHGFFRSSLFSPNGRPSSNLPSYLNIQHRTSIFIANGTDSYGNIWKGKGVCGGWDGVYGL